jgi:hypothetical protein
MTTIVIIHRKTFTEALDAAQGITHASLKQAGSYSFGED